MRKLLALILAVILIGCAPNNQLNYGRLGINHSVVKGGQAEIDAGNVVDIAQPGIWLAAHRTTHGAVFHNLPNAHVGDTVCVYSRCYHVKRIIYYSSHNPPGYIGPLVLQTSMPTGLLLVVAG